MRLRALPQSFWKQPNNPPALSPGNIFSSLPPLSGYAKDDDVAGKVLNWHVPGPEVIKLLSCSTQLRSKFIRLINVKMPTLVGILTFISRINDWLLWFKPEISIDFGYFSIREQLKFHAPLSWEWKKSLLTSGPGSVAITWVVASPGSVITLARFGMAPPHSVITNRLGSVAFAFLFMRKLAHPGPVP